MKRSSGSRGVDEGAEIVWVSFQQEPRSIKTPRETAAFFFLTAADAYLRDDNPERHLHIMHQKSNDKLRRQDSQAPVTTRLIRYRPK